MPVVSITRLRVRSWRYLLPFAYFALRSVFQAKAAKGNLGLSLLRDARLTFWTSTVWADETAMKSFMMSGTHRQAMPKLLDWCDEAALVHWTQPSEEVPSWTEAYSRLQQEGRRSKVRHPSPEQEKYQIAEPRQAA